MALTKKFNLQSSGIMNRQPLEQLEHSLAYYGVPSSNPDPEDAGEFDTELSDTPRLDEVRAFLFEGRPFDDLVKRLVKRARTVKSDSGSGALPSARRGTQNTRVGRQILAIEPSLPQSSDQSRHPDDSTEMAALGNPELSESAVLDGNVVDSAAAMEAPLSRELADRCDRSSQIFQVQECTTNPTDTIIAEEADYNFALGSPDLSSLGSQVLESDRTHLSQSPSHQLQPSRLRSARCLGRGAFTRTEDTPLLYTERV